MKKVAAIVLILLLIGGFITWKLLSSGAASENTDQDKSPSKTVEVKKGSIRLTVETTGRVVPNEEVEIKCKASGEVIKLPPSFAPDMKTKGVEDIRFAPGMFKPDQPDFFSYLFVINSTTGQKFTDEKFLHSELLAYYKGLAKSVSRGAIDPRDLRDRSFI